MSKAKGGFVPNNAQVLMTIVNTKSGRFIEKISRFGASEREVLFPPGTKMRVLDFKGRLGKSSSCCGRYDETQRPIWSPRTVRRG
jgi:hypothetical protein